MSRIGDILIDIAYWSLTLYTYGFGIIMGTLMILINPIHWLGYATIAGCGMLLCLSYVYWKDSNDRE